jgi:ADP-ribosylglycohydrolase
MKHTTAYQKVYGCLMGGAIGDAFGVRVEMMHYRDIEAQYGRVTHFDPLPPRRPSAEPPLERWNPFGEEPQGESEFHPLGRSSHELGVYTDDTRYKLMACQAILHKRGPISGADLAAEWLNYRLMAEGAPGAEPTLSWPGPQRAYARMMASLGELRRMAGESRTCWPGWYAPLGLIHAGDPDQAARDRYPIAVAVASALTPGATLDRVIDAVLEHADCLGEYANEFRGRLGRLLDIAAHCADVFALREPFYRSFLVTFPPWEEVFPLEMIPCALALRYIAKGDAEQAIIGATNMGRDSDSIATMAGDVTGALGGISGLPSACVDQVRSRNPQPDLAETAKALCGVILERAQIASRRTAGLLELFDE